MLGLSPSDVEMEFAEYCLLYDPRLPTTGWRLEAQTKLIVCMTLVQGTIWVHNGLCGDLIPCTVLAPGYSKQL